jgi:fatty acyl-CoA reductase
LSEDLLNEYKSKFPIAIPRPAIVTAANSEPCEGFIEGFHGATGIMLGIGKGIFRSLYCDPDSNAQFIPVDICVNCIIAMAWKKATVKDNELLICNVSTASKFMIIFRCPNFTFN